MQNQTVKMGILELPDELLHLIFSHLPVTELLLSTSHVCTRFKVFFYFIPSVVTVQEVIDFYCIPRVLDFSGDGKEIDDELMITLHSNTVSKLNLSNCTLISSPGFENLQTWTSLRSLTVRNLHLSFASQTAIMSLCLQVCCNNCFQHL